MRTQLALIAILAATACKAKPTSEGEPPAPPVAPVSVAIDAAAAPAPGPRQVGADVAADRLARAGATVGQLKQTLVGELTAAMKQGPAHAATVCNTRAPAIAAGLGTGGVTVGRATRKPRNPANLAAGWQADALTFFEAAAAAGQPVAGGAFARQLADGRTAYAEPLVIVGLCLTCHGTTPAPELAPVLAERYPQDQATGYQLGELRGVAWVELAP